MISFRPHTASVTALAFSPDGQTLASVSHDRTVKAWEVTGLACQSLRWEQVAAGYDVNHCQYSPDGRELFTGGSSGHIQVWAAKTGKLLRQYDPPSGRAAFTSVFAFVLSRTGQEIAWCGQTDRAAQLVVVADAKTLAVKRRIAAHTDDVMILAAYPGGFCSGSDDRQVKFWDWSSSRCHDTLKLRGGVHAMATSPDGTRLAVAGVTTIDGYRLAGHGLAGKPVPLRGHTRRIECVEFSPDGTRLASASVDGTLRLWDATAGECLRTFALKLGGMHWVTFAPDGLTLAYSSLRGDIGLLDVDD